MGSQIKPTAEHIRRTRNGVMIQYEAMFDAETKAKLAQLDIYKFIDYAADRIAHEEACSMFSVSCLHPKSE